MSLPSPEIRTGETPPDRGRSNKYGFIDELDVNQSAHFRFSTIEERNRYRALISSNIAARKKRTGETRSWSVGSRTIPSYGSPDGETYELAVYRTA